MKHIFIYFVLLDYMLAFPRFGGNEKKSNKAASVVVVARVYNLQNNCYQNYKRAFESIENNQ